MSSAGLTYKHFGQEIIINLLREWNQLDRNQNNLDLIYNKLYRNFIMCVDAEDNGINQYPDNIKSKYSNQTTYGHRVSRLNPAWDEENPDQSWQFRQAMDIAEDEFLNQLNSIIRHWIPAYSIVKTSLEKRKEFHPSGCLILLEKCCPWKEHLINLEEEMNIKDQIKLCLYKDTDGGYRIQTIPSSLGSFNFRVGLKEDWRGLKPEDLQTVSNITDIVFVHNSGFIGGAKSLESAIRMSEISLKDKGIIS